MAIEPTLDDATELDRSEESSTSELYRAAIGPLNRDYYLPLFNRFEAADRGGISWNWAAAFTTLNWLAFRQLWSAALAYAGAAVGLALLIFGIGRLVFRFSEAVEWGLLAAFAAALVIVPGLFGNALLHTECRKRMARALAANTTLPEACEMLARQAPSKRRLTTLAAVNGVGLLLVLGAWLNFPDAGSLAQEAVANAGKAVAAPANTASGTVQQALAPVAPASVPAPTVSSPTPATSAPASAASKPVAAASAPTAVASVPAKPASVPATATSALPAVSKPLATASTPAKPASAPAPAASAAKPTASAASTPAKAPAVAASRGTSGSVQADARKPAASAPATAPTTAQETGKVYRSEPAPAANAVAGKPTPAVAASAPARKPQAAASAAKPTGALLINVGLFAVADNAANALVKLKEAGLPAYSQEIRGPKGKFTRVRVGPYANQADADAAAVKIKALGLDALVAPQ